jgi:chromate transport protein ChrA
MWYGYLADLIVGFHAAYVAFVVLGLLAILLGAVLRWRWVGNAWFRVIHLLMIAVVALEAVMGWQCPLTSWERDLRVLADQPASEGTFVGRLLDYVIFYHAPPWAWTLLYVGFALLVLSTFYFAPVRWRRATRGAGSQPADERRQVENLPHEPAPGAGL